MSEDKQKKELTKVYNKLNNLYKKLFGKKNNLNKEDYSSFYKEGIYFDRNVFTGWMFSSMFFDIRTKKDLKIFTSNALKLIKNIKSKYIIEIVGQYAIIEQFTKNKKSNHVKCFENKTGEHVKCEIFDQNIPVHFQFVLRDKNELMIKTPFVLNGLYHDIIRDNIDYKPTKKELKYQDKRIEFKNKNGFDPSECWDLSSVISLFILPRLIHLKNIHHGVFWDTKDKTKHLNEKETDEIYNKMIKSFYWQIIKNNVDCTDLIGCNKDEVQEGLNLFAEHFDELWD